MSKDKVMEEQKEKIIKEAKDDAILKIASAQGLLQDPYPSPFLNLADTQIPKTTSEIFKWCKYFYTFDPLISGAINALATFPVTEVFLEDIEDNSNDSDDDDDLIKSNESPMLQLYKKILFKDLNIHKLLIEIGIDYYLYGNCFIFGEMHTDPDTGEIEWKSMTRLDPDRMIIDYNPATQEKKYKWQVSPAIVAIVKNKKPREDYDKIPDIIKEAVRKRSSVVLNSKNIYHFSRPTDSMGRNIIWGTPIVANVLKLLMYRNILRQAQEAIAREHIVPLRIYYLQKVEGYTPLGNWNETANNLAKELQKAAKDPNYKVVSPCPVGVINLGGDGRALLLTPEIEQIQAEILAGMSVPREFIFGGVSYSGSSISLKILENQFITYRLLQSDFINNFIIKNMAKARKEWVSEADDDSLVKAKMLDLKMQDDVQQKNLVVQMNQTGKVSNEYLWKTTNVDPDKMRESLQDEAKTSIQTEKELKIKQLEADFEVQKKQIEIEAKLMKYRNKVIGPLEQQQMMGQAGQEMGQAGQEMGQAGQEIGQGAGQLGLDEQAQQAQQPGNVNTDQQIEEIAIRLSKLSEDKQIEFLQGLPEHFKTKVLQALEAINSNKQLTRDTSKDTTIDMRQMPQQKPPRRDSMKS